MAKNKKVHQRPDRILRIPKELYAVLKSFCFQYNISTVDEFVYDILSDVAIRHHKNIMDNLPVQQDLISKVVSAQFRTVPNGGR